MDRVAEDKEPAAMRELDRAEIDAVAGGLTVADVARLAVAMVAVEMAGRRAHIAKTL
jgi:hypothetical protein